MLDFESDSQVPPKNSALWFEHFLFAQLSTADDVDCIPGLVIFGEIGCELWS